MPYSLSKTLKALFESNFKTYLLLGTAVFYVFGPLIGWLAIELNPLVGASFFYALSKFPALTLFEGILGAIFGLIFLSICFLINIPNRGRVLFTLIAGQFVVQAFCFLIAAYYIATGRAAVHPASLLIDSAFFLGAFLYIGAYLIQPRDNPESERKLPDLNVKSLPSLFVLALSSLYLLSTLFWSKAVDESESLEVIQRTGFCVEGPNKKAAIYIPKGCILWRKATDHTVFDALCGTQVEGNSWYVTYSGSLGETDPNIENTSKRRICVSVQTNEQEVIECSKIQNETFIRVRFQAPAYPEDRTVERTFESLIDPIRCSSSS